MANCLILPIEQFKYDRTLNEIGTFLELASMLSHPSIYMNRLKNYPFDVHVNDRIKKYRKRKPKLPKQNKRPGSNRVYFCILREKLTATILEYFDDPEIPITLQTVTPLSIAVKDEMEKLSKEYDVCVADDSETSNRTAGQSLMEDINLFTASPRKQISVEDTANLATSSKTFLNNLNPLKQQIPFENAASSSASFLTSSHSLSYHPLKKMSVDAASSSTTSTNSSHSSSYHHLDKDISVEDTSMCSTTSNCSSYQPLEKQIFEENSGNSSTSSTSSDRPSYNADSNCSMDCRDEDNGLSFKEMLRQIKTLEFGEESSKYFFLISIKYVTNKEGVHLAGILTVEERSMLGTILSEVIRYSEISAQMELVFLLGQLDGKKFDFNNFMASVYKDFKRPASPPVKKKRKKEILQL